MWYKDDTCVCYQEAKDKTDTLKCTHFASNWDCIADESIYNANDESKQTFTQEDPKPEGGSGTGAQGSGTSGNSTGNSTTEAGAAALVFGVAALATLF